LLNDDQLVGRDLADGCGGWRATPDRSAAIGGAAQPAKQGENPAKAEDDDAEWEQQKQQRRDAETKGPLPQVVEQRNRHSRGGGAGYDAHPSRPVE
jgi:hypothetical protein